MSAHVVVAYRHTGGLVIYGPYSARGYAATAAAVKANSDEFEAAYVIALEPPEATATTWGEEPPDPP